MNRLPTFVAALVLSTWVANAYAGDGTNRVYATWNDQDANPALTFSTDRLTVFGGSADWASVRATIPVDTGMWYWETTYTYAGNADLQTGLAFTNWSLSDAPGDFGSVARAAGTNRMGEIRVGGRVIDNIEVVLNNTVVRHVFDADSGSYQVANDGGPWVSANVFDGFFARTPQYPIASLKVAAAGTSSVTANFGATPFVYSIPAGANPGIYSEDGLMRDGFDAAVE